MRRWIIDTNCWLALCLLLILPAGCTDENLAGRGGATGKTVIVSLQASLPPAIVPGNEMKQTGAVSRSGQSWQSTDADAPFSVCFEPAQPAASTRASEGTTKLHNLWLFQFDGSGNINGSPQKLTDGVKAINDKVTLEVPLVVSTDQTLYMLVLGPKLEQDFSQVKTLAELENSSINYLTDRGGTAESLITSDAEMPLAGQVSGITVRDIDSGKQGLVEYNTPAGFTGGIELRSLMARITLRYNFEVENYRLQGLRLLNVSKTIRLKNPAMNDEEADAYEVLENITLGVPDATGLRTQTWYVAQNRRGTVSSILTEDKRYYKVSGSTVSGAAPPLGTQIEAWAYSTVDADEYAIYQMYVGNNNTDNFDVEPNHYYNLRTTINTELGSAKADERIRAYAAQQSINFRASAIVAGTAGAYDKPDVKYDLDAHCDTRPIDVTAHGRIVSVGIYTDEAATQQAPANGWLRLSTSSNYTEAYNNTIEPLGTFLTAKTVLPKKLKFYLYSDEYIYQDGTNTLPDTGPDGMGGKRSLYVKITTAVEGEAGLTESTTVYRMDQRPAIYCGRFGGAKQGGAYTMGLLCEQINEKLIIYSEDVKQLRVYPGYASANPAAAGYDTDNMDNGKTATRKLSENPDNLNVNVSYVSEIEKDASGHVLLYQYQYSNTIAARACYDLNRDENGNGLIDNNELVWYLPASNQLIGVYIGNYIDRVKSTLGISSTERSGAPAYSFIRLYANEVSSAQKNASEGKVCVRDIPLP